MPNGRCYKHGGASLAGIASPSFRTGRWSKYVPRALLSRYKAAADDPDLLSLRSEISVTDIRISMLLEALTEGEAGTLWRQLRKAWREVKKAQKQDDSEAFGTGMTVVGGLIQRGARDVDTWNELAGKMDDRRRLVDSERRRLRDLHQMITAEELMAFMTRLQMELRDVVKEPEQRARIADRIRALVAGG